jgi:hypothetical protein
VGAGWAVTAFDTNGRVAEIQYFSGSALPCPWGSNGNSTGTATTSYLSNSTTSKDERASTEPALWMVSAG